MEKITTEMKETRVRKQYCDICGVELHWNLACSVARCSICSKDLCNDCVGHEEDDYGDYRHVWCKHCWEIGEKYREQICRLTDECSELYRKWSDEARGGIS